jgi:hypothetical protein
MEIVLRYYYQRGAVAQNMKTDKFLVEAVNLLDDSMRYASILSAPAK